MLRAARDMVVTKRKLEKFSWIWRNLCHSLKEAGEIEYDRKSLIRSAEETFGQQGTRHGEVRFQVNFHSNFYFPH